MDVERLAIIAVFGAFGLIGTPLVGLAQSQENLASRRPATASSSVSNTRSRMNPEFAVDGDLNTRWSGANGANDPKVPGWWSVDLGEAKTLGGCEIIWERSITYTYVVEGSLDGVEWFTLNDQRGTDLRTREHHLMVPGKSARYVRIHVSKIEGNGAVSISEVRIFDAQSMAKLPEAARLEFVRDEPYFENIALQKPAIASSVEGKDRVATMALDGNPNSRWCASDPSKPQWWEVDLESERTLDTVQIRWENEKSAYRYVIEASTDNLEWETLIDRRNNTRAERTTSFTSLGKNARYLRITITGTGTAGSWASFYEFRVSELPKLTPAQPD